MKSATETWLNHANSDMEAAAALLADDLLGQCIFFCQQAIEKALKANWLERATRGVPPRSHDLLQLAEDIELPLSQEQSNLMRYLHEEYTASRYPDEAASYEKFDVQLRYAQTKELFEWLRQKLS